MIADRPAPSGLPPVLENPSVLSPATRKRRALELGVVLLLIGPSFALSYFVTNSGSPRFWLITASTILRDLGLLALLAYFVWVNGERLLDLGWRRDRAWVDALLGLALFAPLTISASTLQRALEWIGVPGPPASQQNLLEVSDLPEAVVGVLLVLVIAVTEETLFRGYLIRRFGALSSSVSVAVVASTLVFSLGHGYEGVSGMITVAYMGATFAVIYLWRRSLVAPATMHFAQDFLAIVLIPLLR